MFNSLIAFQFVFGIYAQDAAKTGLKAEDKIVKLAGKEIRNVQDYTVVLGDMKPDVEYEIEFIRGTERFVRKITPVARKQ